LSLSRGAYHARGKVTVAHPGTQHSYQTAIGLQQADLLGKYITGYYYKKKDFISSIVSHLPLHLRHKLERQLNRRRSDLLNEDSVTRVLVPELAYIACARSRILRQYSSQVLRWRNETFDRLVSKSVDRLRPSAVICYDSSALTTFRACRRAGSIAVLDQSVGHILAWHRIATEEASLNPEFGDSLLTTRDEWAISRCQAEAKEADVILAASDYVKDTLISEGVERNRIRILPYGADTERFRPVERERDGVFRVLFVGALSQRKGIKYLLEAISQLRLPGLQLLLVGGVVGSGSALKRYSGEFKHIPQVPFREVHSLFQSADIFVYPSLHEGSALAIYEALASGLPVVTTHNSGSIVRDGLEGFIVPIRNVEELKVRIELLYRNPELRRDMGRRARQRAESFTWDIYRNSLAKLMVEVIGERGHQC
jgi:starch synthase